MSSAKTFKSLSKDRQCLVRLMADVQFGVIVDLKFVGGEPDFTTPPTVFRRHHFGEGKERRVTKARDDFALKAALVSFFDLCDQLVNFQIDELKIEGGLPQALCTVEVADV